MRGRDKAPLPSKAEAKADRYQPIIKAVDDWRPQQGPRLTDFCGTRPSRKRRSRAMKILKSMNPVGERSDLSRRRAK
jgi:hypothetical protein